MKFPVDANLPPALAGRLAEDGDEAVYVYDLSKDADFAARAARDQAVRVVWIRCGNLKLSLFRIWFADRADAMRRLLLMDERLIELRCSPASLVRR